jgi:hypothetical protein
VLAPCGLKDAAAVYAALVSRSVIHRFSTLELAGGVGLPLDADERFRVLCRMLVASLRELAGNNQHT